MPLKKTIAAQSICYGPFSHTLQHDLDIKKQHNPAGMLLLRPVLLLSAEKSADALRIQFCEITDCN